MAAVNIVEASELEAVVQVLVLSEVVLSEVVLSKVVLVVWRLALVARRVAFAHGLSSPEREKAADEEAKGTEVEWKVDCEKNDPVLVIDPREVLEGAGERSLTDPPPGGWT